MHMYMHMYILINMWRGFDQDVGKRLIPGLGAFLHLSSPMMWLVLSYTQAWVPIKTTSSQSLLHSVRDHYKK